MKKTSMEAPHLYSQVLDESGIPQEFSKKSLKEAQAFSSSFDKEKKQRKDLTKKKFITIDGETAKDFDDAVLVERRAHGYTLSVAIADVSHYVLPESALDKEAYKRGNSSYLPGFVSPMLPFRLSEDLCSLRPQVERLALVVEMDLSFQGAFLSKKPFRFYEAVIKSHARTTYTEVQQIINKKKVPHLEHLKSEIQVASELAHILKKQRTHSLDLDFSETVIDVDKKWKPKKIHLKKRLFAHQMIEEFMLMANKATALFLKKENSLYRVHDEPKKEGLEALRQYVSTLGLKFSPKEGNIQNQINQLLKKIKDKNVKNVFSFLCLRSLSQAEYSPKNKGHFGLNFDDYTHFTSPIRRYCDLVIHRLVKAKCKKLNYSLSEEKLQSLGTHLSACEQRSVKAERKVESLLKGIFMKPFLGEVFSGSVSSVVDFGLFITLDKYPVDGLLHIKDLSEDYFYFDEKKISLVGRRTRKAYKLGTPVKVCLARVDENKIDFVLVDENGKVPNLKKKKKSFSQRKRKSTRKRNVSKVKKKKKKAHRSAYGFSRKKKNKKKRRR